MSRTLLLSLLGGAAALAVGAALILGRSDAPDLSPVPAAQAQETDDPAAADDADAPEVMEMVQGDPDAPVTVIEYASFTCPHCRAFHEDTYPALREAYIDTGLVRFVYREVYFDRYGLWAGMVARCAGPMRYFGLVDLIYENQSEWISNDPAATADNLRRLGRQAGLSDEDLNACLTDSAMAEAMIANYEAHMEEHPITGTPTFVIDGELLNGNRDLEDLAARIDPLLPEDAAEN